MTVTATEASFKLSSRILIPFFYLWLRCTIAKHTNHVWQTILDFSVSCKKTCYAFGGLAAFTTKGYCIKLLVHHQGCSKFEYDIFARNEEASSTSKKIRNKLFLGIWWLNVANVIMSFLYLVVGVLFV